MPALAARAHRPAGGAAGVRGDAGRERLQRPDAPGGGDLDLFGNGKTALKATLGKYLESTVTASNYGLGNPTSRIATNVTRTWTDRNGNWTPDCNLSNPQTQDFGPAGDFCGVISNLNFGTATFSNTIDPDILQGWGVRPSDWNWGVSVQHELLARTSVEVGFFHREFFGFAVTDNLAVSPSDFTQFSIPAPQDPRLPGGGGYQVGPLYDLNNPALFGVTRNYITYSDRYGDAYQKFNGIDITFNVRPRNGLTLQGGFSGGYSTSDNCEVREKVPEIGLLNPYCRIETGFLPQYQVDRELHRAEDRRLDQRHLHQQARHQRQRIRYARHRRRLRRQLHIRRSPRLGRPLAGNAPNIT